MRLYIGVDFHPYQQTVCWMDVETGELRSQVLRELDEVREFYKNQPTSIVGIEASSRAVWFEDLRDAHTTERRLKGWSRAKKEALIARDYTQLQILAKRPSRRPACFEAPLRGAPQHDERGVQTSLSRHPEVRVSRAKLGTRASKESA